jgi:hypothetical protein
MNKTWPFCDVLACDVWKQCWLHPSHGDQDAMVGSTSTACFLVGGRAHTGSLSRPVCILVMSSTSSPTKPTAASPERLLWDEGKDWAVYSPVLSSLPGFVCVCVCVCVCVWCWGLYTSPLPLTAWVTSQSLYCFLVDLNPGISSGIESCIPVCCAKRCGHSFLLERWFCKNKSMLCSRLRRGQRWGGREGKRHFCVSKIPALASDFLKYR